MVVCRILTAYVVMGVLWFVVFLDVRRAESASEALKSASRGRFQVMGRCYVNPGHFSVEDFVRDMNRSGKKSFEGICEFYQI